MAIVPLIVIILAVGVLVWAAERYLRAAEPFKGIAIFLVVLLGVLLVLRQFGVVSM